MGSAASRRAGGGEDRAAPLIGATGGGGDDGGASGGGGGARKRATEPPPKPPPPPFQQRAYASQFVFTYIYPVLAVGSTHGKLTWDDLPLLGAADDPARLVCDIAAARRAVPGRSFPATLWRLRWAPFLYSGVLLAAATGASLFTPVALHALLTALDDPGASRGVRYGWAAGLFVCSLVPALTLHRFWWEATRVGLHAQMAQTTDVLVKCLGLSGAARARLGRGRLINHMAVDACRLNDNYVLPFLHWNTWCAVASVAVCVANLGALLGAAGLVGCSAMVILVPGSTLITRLSKRSSELVQTRRDARGLLIGDALASIQTLKAANWVPWFGRRIAAARASETAAMQRKQLLSVAADFMGVALPVLIMALTLGLYSVLERGAPLTAATAFAAVSWIANLQQPLRAMPNTITSFVDAHISLRRLRELDAAEDADVSGLSAWRAWLLGAAASASADLAAAATSGAGSTGEHVALLLDGQPQPPPTAEQPPLPMAGWLRPEQLPRLDDDGYLQPSSAAPHPPCGGGGIASSGGNDDDAAIALDGAAFGWPADSSPPAAAASGASGAAAAAPPAAGAATSVREVLSSASFTCRRGTLTFVVSRVGGGKSTLLAGLVGEAVRLRGTACVRGTVAYAGQSPWVLNRTLRDNITFVSPWDPGRYAAVVAACALDADAATFKRGHDQLIGENGITLSGGQRARVALARALYADVDVYVLDDVLSAVDAVVGAHIWRHAVVGLLLSAGKTVLLASHATHHCSRPEVTQVVLLADGVVRAVGPYAAVAPLEPGLLQRAPPAPLPSPSLSPSAASDGKLAATASATHSDDNDDDGGDGEGSDVPAASAAGATKSSSDGNDDDDGAAEKYASGTVKARHVWSYLAAMGPPAYLACLGLLYVLSQAAAIVSSWWLVQWTSSNNSSGGGGGNTGGAAFYAGVYAGLCGATALLTLARMTLLSVGAVRASSALHNAAMHAVLRAPAAFFAANPAGRVLNRFTADVATIDNSMRYSISALALQVFGLVGVLVVVGLTVPAVLAVVALLAVAYYDLAQKYRLGARDLRRLQSTAKSPILSHFAETLRGVDVLRAAGPAAATAFVARHVEHTRAHARAFFAYWAANEFVSTALEVIGALVIGAVVALAVWQHDRGTLSTGAVGFALSFSLQLPQLFMWLTRQVSMLETDAVAVERLAELAGLQGEEDANALPPPVSAAAAVAGAAPLPHPPPALQLSDVVLRYGPTLPDVLCGASLTVPAGAKVAVIGRTGAGKSSLLQAVLRMYPYQAGGIAVGGVPLATVSCAAARSLVTPLLQDGALFTGSVRENLLGPRSGGAVGVADNGDGGDADGASTVPLPPVPDEAVWRALDALHVGAAVRALPGGLDAPVAEGGAGFSAGERALLCLARALLSRHGAPSPPGLLLADEPTASVDALADAIVHDALLAAPCAVVCICHRLQYVHRFDLVAVVEGGAVVEVGPPAALLAATGAGGGGRLRRLLRSARGGGSGDGGAH